MLIIIPVIADEWIIKYAIHDFCRVHYTKISGLYEHDPCGQLCHCIGLSHVTSRYKTSFYCALMPDSAKPASLLLGSGSDNPFRYRHKSGKNTGNSSEHIKSLRKVSMVIVEYTGGISGISEIPAQSRERSLSTSICASTESGYVVLF